MGAKVHGPLLRQNEYVAGGVIKIGDFVIREATGKVIVAAAGNTAGLQGVAMSYASAADVKVLVADHPEQEFLINRSSTAPSSQADYLLNYDLVANTTSTIEGNHTIDSASGATTPSTLPLRAVGAGRQSVVPGGTSDCIVRINNHADRAGQIGV